MSHFNDLTFRLLSSGDLDAVCSIESSVYEDPWSYALFEQSLNAPFTYNLGIFQEKDCLGYAICQIIFEEAHLLNIAVSPPLQRQGLGMKLLKKVMEEARKREARTLFLEVRPSNQAAERLYEKEGFVHVTTREKYYPNGEDACVLMKML